MRARRDPEERFWPKVEKTAACWNWIAGKNYEGYGIFWDGERYVTAHRFAHSIAAGKIPEKMQVDHTCHNRGCVNPTHLRLATPKQNMENPSGVRSDNRSGYRGVSWNKAYRAWTGLVTHYGVDHWLGPFASSEEANVAVVAKRNELFTHNILDRKSA